MNVIFKPNPPALKKGAGRGFLGDGFLEAVALGWEGESRKKRAEASAIG